MLSVVAPSSQSPDVGMQPEVTAETKRVTGQNSRAQCLMAVIEEGGSRGSYV